MERNQGLIVAMTTLYIISLLFTQKISPSRDWASLAMERNQEAFQGKAGDDQ